ncbi:hypothetical protein AYO47_02210 [Planctomyces sp. SCGC AG-212-M04]|nr:hypothetical protein AYO47_02210 [Planctomyces sp. SCGC AG-212-M04]
MSKLTAQLLSIALIGAGVASIAAAQGAPLFAAEELNCVAGEWIEPAECTAAHAEPAPDDRKGGTEGGCGFVNGNCQAQGNACDASPNFNNAAKGECQAYLGGSETYRCSNDYYKTAVTLTKVTGGCDSVNGDCACRYSKAMPVETMNVQVCNCKSELR